MTPGSVAMLLGETTGLRVQTTAPSLGAANVRVQGLRGRYAQLLADGLPLYGSGGDSLGLLQVPPLDLGQVEVIKGAASALYGPAALGGVINLASRRAEESHVETLLNVTSLGGGDATVWLGRAPVSGWSWTLLGGAHGQRRRDMDDDGWTDVAAYKRGVVRPRVFYESGAARRVPDRRRDRRGSRGRDHRRGRRPRRAAVRRAPGDTSRGRRRSRPVAVRNSRVHGARLVFAQRPGSTIRRGTRARHAADGVRRGVVDRYLRPPRLGARHGVPAGPLRSGRRVTVCLHVFGAGRLRAGSDHPRPDRERFGEREAGRAQRVRRPLQSAPVAAAASIDLVDDAGIWRRRFVCADTIHRGDRRDGTGARRPLIDLDAERAVSFRAT